MRSVQRKKSKGQIAVEFSFMIMLAFVFLVVVLIVVAYYVDRASVQRRDAALTDEAAYIQEELLLAAGAPDGYQRTFTIPHDADGYEYVVSNAESTLTISIKDSVLNKPIPPVVGVLAKGPNTIRKHDGIIEVV